ncbi:LysM peptidoglycan-binding domain-containing protein [Paenibacillus caseinilyticus]|nr:LysM peptidoglycan-binding domain-containing protein [Paenibacillus caseinilyticus]
MRYIVQRGDTVFLISRKYGVPIETLVQVNAIYNGVIYIGQELYIPVDPSRERKKHIVQPGENLGSIAQMFHTTKQVIMQQNGLTNDEVYLGQVLYIDVRVDSAGPTIPSASSQAGHPPFFDSHITGGTEQPLNGVTPLEFSIRPTDEATYTVEIGDTLDSISAKLGIPKSTIMELNKLGDEKVIAGQKLTVNPKGSVRIQSPTAPSHSSSFAATPYKIAYKTIYDTGLQAPIKVWKESNGNGVSPIFFVSKLAVTGAGAHKTYHQNSSAALDFLSTAGIEGYWWGLATDESGTPLKQGKQDPAEGYYISKTALNNCKLPSSDPHRYLDALVIPYIALPAFHMLGAKLGDFCVVINTKNKEWSYAILGDVWPGDSVGIGSIALAEKLKMNPSPKSGGVEDGILYIIFPQSSESVCSLKTVQEIENMTSQLFKNWGGMKMVHTLFPTFPLSYKTS